MEPAEFQRIGITAVEAGYLTLGCWNGIAKGFELKGYCHECDDPDASSTVTDYFLDLSQRCVTAEVRFNCCNTHSLMSFAILEEKLLANVLTASRDVK